MNTKPFRRRLLLDALPAALLACTAAAQWPAQPLVAFPLPDLRVPIPPSLGSTAARQLVDCDLDGDMLRDACILWDNGEATLAYAPEVLSSFTPFPMTGIRDLARVPSDFATPAHPGRDGILVLDGNGLGYVTLVASTLVPSASELRRADVDVGPAWHALERLAVTPRGAQCWVLGLAPGHQTVHFGKWTGTQLVDLGSVTASAAVQQMLLLPPPTAAEALPLVAVRTVAGVQMWTMGGQALATLPSPTASALGALTQYQSGGLTRLAWLALSGNTWRLRTIVGAEIATDVQLTFQTTLEALPDRFRPTGMDVMPMAFGGQDGLVLYQNTRPWHVVLQPDAATGFAPKCGIEVPGLTSNVDNCPSAFVDLDRDGQGDVATVLSSLHCLQYALRVPVLAEHSGQPAQMPDGPSSYDYLGDICHAQEHNGVADTIDLPFLVPLEFRERVNRRVQVVAWPQDVGNPVGPVYAPAELGAPLQQYLYALPDGPTAEFTLRFPLPLEPTPVGGQWNPHHQAFLMLRLVEVDTMGDDGPHVVWSSPPQLVAFVAGDDTTPKWNESLGFAESLSEPQNPPRTSVQGHGRHIGVLLRPLRIRLPSSTVTTPSPAGATNAAPQ